MLTRRQIDVLTRATMTNRQIGAALGISHHTVKNHFTALYRRLGVGGNEKGKRTGALVTMLENGMIGLDEIHEGDGGAR